MKLGISEIFEKASQLKSRKEKVEYLRKFDCRPIQDLIQYALHPAIMWDLPPGTPPYKPTEFLDQQYRIYQETRKLYIFVNGNGSNLPVTKLESLFIQLLESIDPEDAKLVCLVKDRKLPKGLTQSLIDEIWPGLIPNEQDQKVS